MEEEKLKGKRPLNETEDHTQYNTPTKKSKQHHKLTQQKTTKRTTRKTNVSAARPKNQPQANYSQSSRTK
jgi:hypothetical protein